MRQFSETQQETYQFQKNIYDRATKKKQIAFVDQKSAVKKKIQKLQAELEKLERDESHYLENRKFPTIEEFFRCRD